MQRRRFAGVITAMALALGLAGGGLGLARAADNWPDKPLRFVLSQPPGSGPDTVARLVADALAQNLGQPVVVENKPGGQNTIGALAAAKAPADGYTYYFGTTAALVTNPLLFKSLAYAPREDFTPVAFVSRSPFAWFVRADSPVQSVAELVQTAQGRQGTYAVGHEGPRTFGGMIARLFNARTAANANLVSYASVGNGVSDLMGGHVDALVTGLASASELARQGRLRVLAMTGGERVKGWDDVPALVETLPGFQMEGWQVIVAPTGTPPAVVGRMNAAVRAVLAQPAVRARLESVGQIPGPDWSATQLGEFLNAEHQKWTRVTQEIGVLPE